MIRLADGRALGIEHLGDPAGEPLFFFHGTPGSRLVLSADDALAEIPGLRIIVPERPGYGVSDPLPGRTLLDWGDDVGQVAARLGIDTFSVAGESGGGPHALAVAAHSPDRVRRVLLFASPSPVHFPGATRGMAIGNRLGIRLGRFVPGFIRWTTRGAARAFERSPDRFVDAVARQMAAPDRVLLEQPAYRAAFIRDMREAYRQGSDAQALDGALAMSSRSWGFELADIEVPVHLWHGEEDVLVTRAMAEHLASTIPDCMARFVPAAGHLLTGHAQVIADVRKLFEDAGT